MSSRRPIEPVPDFTNACLVMAFVNLFWVMVVVWAVAGFPAALGLAWIVDRAIARLGRTHRQRRG